MIFLGAVWGFLKSPWGIRIGIVLLCLLAFRWYGNWEYGKGKDAGVKEGGALMLEAKKAEWQKVEDSIATRTQELDQQDKILAGQKAELLSLRRDLNGTLIRIQASGQASREAANAIVSSIPGDALDAAIRSKSTELGPPKASK